MLAVDWEIDMDECLRDAAIDSVIAVLTDVIEGAHELDVVA